jgi:hypothetical protein
MGCLGKGIQCSTMGELNTNEGLKLKIFDHYIFVSQMKRIF